MLIQTFSEILTLFLFQFKVLWVQYYALYVVECVGMSFWYILTKSGFSVHDMVFGITRKQ